MDLVYLFYSESWLPWMTIGVLFILNELFNLAKLTWFAAGISSFVIAVLCFFFPNYFIAYTNISDLSELIIQVTKQSITFFIFYFLVTNFIVPGIMKYIYGEVVHGTEAFAGKSGKALTHLRKNDFMRGRVLFDGLEWAAIPDKDSPDIMAGSTVEVVRIEDWVLWVKLEKK